MTYRDDRPALEARIASLESDLRTVRDENERLRAAQETRKARRLSMSRRSVPWFVAAMLALPLSLLVPQRWDELLPVIGMFTVLMSVIGVSRLLLRTGAHEVFFRLGTSEPRQVEPGRLVVCFPWEQIETLDVAPVVTTIELPVVHARDGTLSLRLTVRASVEATRESRAAAFRVFLGRPRESVVRHVRDHIVDAVNAVAGTMPVRAMREDWAHARDMILSEVDESLRAAGLRLESLTLGEPVRVDAAPGAPETDDARLEREERAADAVARHARR